MQDKPSSGKVIFEGKDAASFSQKEKEDIRNFHFGFVYQHYNLLESLSVLENIEMPLLLRGLSERKAEREARRLLSRFQMEGLSKRSVKALSGGEKQRVSLLRALAGNPAVVFADEPTGALDQANGESVMETFRLAAKEKLIIMVSHNEALVARYCDAFLRLKDGRVVENHLAQKESHPKAVRYQRKSGKHWMLLLLKTHLKENKKKNILSFMASFVGYLTVLLSVGFFHGSSFLAENETKRTLLYYSASISKEETVPLPDSPLSLTKISRPSEEETLSLIGGDIRCCVDYSYFFPRRSAYTFEGKEEKEVIFSPIEDLSLASFGSDLLKEGTGSLDLNACLCNEEFAALHQDVVGKEIALHQEVTLLLEERKEVIPIQYRFYVSGVVSEFPFLNEPRIYYDYDAIALYLDRIVCQNGKTLYSLIREADNEEAISGFDYLLFALNDRGRERFLELEAKEGYSLACPSLSTANSFESLHQAVILSIAPFLILDLAMIVFIVGSLAFSAFLERKREAAILNALGARRGDIIRTYVLEGMLISLCGMIGAIIGSFPGEYLLNLFLKARIHLSNLIQIPYASYFGIPFLLVGVATLFALLLGYLGARIPLQSLYLYPLSEALREE